MKTSTFKTQEQIDIETKIKNLSDRQAEIRSESGVDGLPAAYFSMEAELDSLFDQLDEIIKQPVGVTEEEIAAVRGAQIVEKFEVMKIGESLFSVYGFWYGVKEHKMRGNAAAVAKWINEYTGKRTPIKVSKDRVMDTTVGRHYTKEGK